MTESVFPGSLVDAAWLAAHLENGDVRVIDIRGYVHTADLGNGQQHADYVAAAEEYAAAHIPGSVFVDWTVDITDPESPI
ncbi:MAG: sulfurtransferase, partial [Chloroflexia bacterium]|nr:sulfurtransferase [Chloroflexia bacterium]